MFSKEKIKEEVSLKGLKERFSSETISDNWKKVKKVSGAVFIVSSLITAAPITLPVTVAAWVGYLTLVSGLISGRAQMNKSKK